MQLETVTLAVRDLDRSVAFYRTAIGLDLLAAGAHEAELGFAGTHRLTLIERATAAPRGDAAGLFHVAWLLDSRAHLGAALVRLASVGIGLTGAADHHVSEAVYLDDPDGHGIELYADRPRDTWQRNGALVMTNSRHGLQINGIGPGYFKTEMNTALIQNHDFNAWVEKRTPAGRWGDVEELQGVCIFLASDASSYVNGQVIYVDGGTLAVL
jgi:catechol-2,3-dioxygenase